MTSSIPPNRITDFCRKTKLEDKIMTMNRQEAKALAGNWKQFDSFIWLDNPVNADDYMIVHTLHRNSGLLAQSNASMINKRLAIYTDSKDVIPQHFTHWLAGWIDGYAIRVVRNGELTEAMREWLKIQDELSNYPILDEVDYYRREYEATLEAVKDSAKWECDTELTEEQAV